MRTYTTWFLSCIAFWSYTALCFLCGRAAHTCMLPQLLDVKDVAAQELKGDWQQELLQDKRCLKRRRSKIQPLQLETSLSHQAPGSRWGLGEPRQCKHRTCPAMCSPDSSAGSTDTPAKPLLSVLLRPAEHNAFFICKECKTHAWGNAPTAVRQDTGASSQPTALSGTVLQSSILHLTRQRTSET